MKCVIASVFCLLASSVSGQLLKPGQCRDEAYLSVFPNFRLSDYLGTWFEISRYETRIERNADCVTAEFRNSTDGAVSVLNTQVHLTPRVVSTETGTVRFSTPSLPPMGHLNITYTRSGSPQTMDYKVMDTDYNSYAIVYSCHDYDLSNKYEYAWVLSRTRTITNNATLALVQETLRNSHITHDALRQTNQDERTCTGAAGSATASILTIMAAAILGQLIKQ